MVVVDRSRKMELVVGDRGNDFFLLIHIKSPKSVAYKISKSQSSEKITLLLDDLTIY